MPKNTGYRPGGVHDTGGKDYGYNGGEGSSVTVTSMGAGMGTGYDQPNTKDHASPGGYGSSGSKSKSSPSSK